MSSQENPYQSNLNREEEQAVAKDHGRSKRGNGCLYGCLFAILGIVLLFLVVLIGGYYFLKGQITQYTDPEPTVMPVVDLSEEELADVTDRVTTFKDSVTLGADENQPDVITLTLTADDINALIAQNPDFQGHVYVEIQEEKLAGQVSIPTDFLPIGKGRYFNATATFKVMLNDGVLFVMLADASVKGTPIPQQFLDSMRGENLAKEMNNDPNFAGTIRQLESIVIEDGKIVLTARPKPPEEEATSEPTATVEEPMTEMPEAEAAAN